MKNKLSAILIALICCISSICTFAQDSASVNPVQKDTTLYKRKTLFFPIVANAPETSLQLGASATHLFKMGINQDITRTSYIQASGWFTFKEQFNLSLNHHVFFDREKYISNGAISFSRFPENFYGIGNQSVKDSMETVSYFSFSASERIQRNVYKKFFVGIQYSFVRMFDVSFEYPQRFSDETVYGRAGGNVSGLGPSIIWDSRSSVINSKSGSYLEVSSYFNKTQFGSDFNFNTYIIDLRKYVPLSNNKGVVAFQAYAMLHDGDAPFRQMSMLGGTNLMRGYYAGRFRDKDMMAAQIEYRSPLVFRDKWGFVLFAAAGQVAPAMDGFNISAFKPSAGGGLRWLISKKENLNMRIDFAVGQDTHAFYINIAEAF